VEDYVKKVETAIKMLVAEAFEKLEKKKRLKLRDAIVLALYLNMRKVDQLREDVDGVLRAFHRLEELVDVVKQLKPAVEALQRGRAPDDVAKILRDISTKLDQILLAMRKVDQLREDVDGVLRAFHRLEELVDVVKQLKPAVEALQRGRAPDDVAKVLRDISTKLDQILLAVSYSELE